jgi:hypothetical protein
MKSVVFDLDDLCDKWNPWRELHEWKERNPNGKVTLFTIPQRISDTLLKQYLDLDWIEIAMHGWYHTKGECFYWTEEDAMAKFQRCVDRGFIRGFKAPHWLMTPAVYRAAHQAGWWVADHHDRAVIRDEVKDKPRCYTYNDGGRDVIRAHGHTHNIEDNGIDEAMDHFTFKKDTPFLFIGEYLNG